GQSLLQSRNRARRLAGPGFGEVHCRYRGARVSRARGRISEFHRGKEVGRAIDQLKDLKLGNGYRAGWALGRQGAFDLRPIGGANRCDGQVGVPTVVDEWETPAASRLSFHWGKDSPPAIHAIEG